jgi:hypothetical protein
LKELEEAGIAAVVMPSLFEEQVEFEEDQFASLPEFGGESFCRAHSFFPELDDYNTGPDEYLRTIEAAREAVGVPIIGSLNGFTSGGWTHYARKIESAGGARSGIEHVLHCHGYHAVSRNRGSRLSGTGSRREVTDQHPPVREDRALLQFTGQFRSATGKGRCPMD